MPTVFDYAILGTINDLEEALRPGKSKSDYRVLINHCIKILKGVQVKNAYMETRLDLLKKQCSDQAEITELWLGKTNATGELLRTKLRELTAAIELDSG